MWEVDETTFIHTAGVDAWVFNRFFRNAARLFAVVSVISVCVLLPLNASDPGGSHDETVVTNVLTLDNVTIVSRDSADLVGAFESLSIANISAGSYYLIIHVLCYYLFSFLFMRMLFKTWYDFLYYRHNFIYQQYINPPPAITSSTSLWSASSLSSSPTSLSSSLLTLLVQSIPGVQRNEKHLYELFESIVPGQVKR